jgi:hypothetical protein
MIDIVQYLPGKRKQTPSGWISFNAVCCSHNGEKQDKRQRGGLKANEQGWSYHCFNCGYKASFILGRNVSYKAKKLLSWLGVPDSEIEHLNLESLKYKNIHGILEDRQRIVNNLADIKFEEFDEFPPYAEPVSPEHQVQWEYLRSRCAPDDYPFLTAVQNDNIHWTRPQVIIPFTWDNTVVGWSARMLDNKIPKYINHTQPGYVFGTDLQHSDWEHVLVMEGVFCALSISGLAVMHSTISDTQARLIRNLGKQVTVIPDQDKAGIDLIDRAVELGWAVSIPNWGNCKDVNDSVIAHGKLATLVMIMQARETSKIKIEMRKKQLLKKLTQHDS